MKLYEYGTYSNILSFLGNLSDIINTINMKNFFNLIGSEIILTENKYFFNFDFINNIIFDFLINFENLNYVLFLGINLRLEIPVLNSKLLKYNNIKFFNIGLLNSYTFTKIKNIGNNLLNFIDILKGKSSFNLNIFYKSFINSIYAYYNKINGICFFFGQSFYNINNNFYLFNITKEFIKNNFINSFCTNLFNSIGIINYYLLGNNKKFFFFKKTQFIFFDMIDDNSFLNKFKFLNNSFIVYRGSFFENGAKFSNLIFPSLTFFESNNYHYNCYGILCNAKKIIHNEFEIVNDFYIYLINFYKLYFFNNFCVIKNFFKVLKFFKFLNIEFIIYDFKNIFFKTDIFLKRNIFIENNILSSIIINFYKTDIYSRNSKNLHLASLDYLKHIIIYN
jgi:hypothetical protein